MKLLMRKRGVGWVIISAFALTLALNMPVKTVVSDAQAWVINGQEQHNIPFWYTLCEAVKAFMIGDSSPDSCSAIE